MLVLDKNLNCEERAKLKALDAIPHMGRIIKRYDGLWNPSCDRFVIFYPENEKEIEILKSFSVPHPYCIADYDELQAGRPVACHFWINEETNFFEIDEFADRDITAYLLDAANEDWR